MAATIVVGVDGSPGGDAALRWALAEARLRGAEVHAIHAWTYPYLADVSFMAAASVDRDVLQTGAKEVLVDSVGRASGEAPDVVVHEIVAEGPAAQVLTEAATSADLLVVGTRGRGGFAGLLLGSTSQQVAHHATCPVVIVPPPPT